MWRSVLACLLALVMLGVSIPTRPAYAAPPPNDNFAAAAVAALSSSATAVTTEATTEAGEPMPTTDTCITQPTPLGKTVWYTFLAPGLYGRQPPSRLRHLHSDLHRDRAQWADIPHLQ